MEETKHLSQGSTHPPVIKGSLRLYNMRFCPYAERALLVAEAKKIKYDVVNVDLTTKPDWFLALNPRGQVPTLEFEDGGWLGESLIISDFLDEEGSEGRSLYPEGPRARAEDRLLVDRYNEFITLFYKLAFAFGKPDQDYGVFDKLVAEVQKLETELATRGTNFFGGSLPGMVDYMIWPWLEREGLLRLSDSKLDIFKDRLTGMSQWCARMREDPAVKKWMLSTEVHVTYLKGRLSGKTEYDFLLEASSAIMEETKHLTQGSTHPPVIKGSMRLYNMRFCPFAERALLVAEAKKIKYDVVNVDLTTKPDWFLALNPRGQVPTLEFENGGWLGESTIISDFLDEEASDGRSLYPEGPRARAEDRLLVDRYNEFIKLFYKFIHASGKPDQDYDDFDKLVAEVQRLETELAARGTNFFGGSLPGMVDYMIWPWLGEREGLLRLSDSKLDIFKGRLPGMTQWCGRMREDPAVKKWMLSTEVHAATYFKGILSGNFHFDYLVKNK